MKTIEVKIDKTEKFFLHGWIHPNKPVKERVRVKGHFNDGVLTSVMFDRLSGIKKVDIDALHRGNFGENASTGRHRKDSPASTRVRELISMVPYTDSEKGHTLYKLYYGDRFIINKGMTLAGSLVSFIKGFASFEANQHKSYQDKSNHFFKAFNYIHKNPGNSFDVRVICSNVSPSEILLTEQQVLLANMSDSKCLNSNLTAYIPKTIRDGLRGGWIPEEAIRQLIQAFGEQVDFPVDTLQQPGLAKSE